MQADIFIFQRSKPNFAKLTDYGFRQEGDVYRYSKMILGGDFTVVIEIAKTGEIHTKVIDRLTDEEYVNVRISSHRGEFVNQVREAYYAVLEEVKQHCFFHFNFASEQANRLAGQLLERYQSQPEFLWAKFPHFGVFRHNRSQKWFAIIMNIAKQKMTGNKEDKAEVDVLNVKATTEKIAELMQVKGFYPAYHMNKRNWVSVLLDDSVADEQILALLESSYQAVQTGKAKQTADNLANTEWIVPANPKYYDVEQAFAENEEIVWKQNNYFTPGDTVYLYLIAPRAEIVFKCIVTEINLPNHIHHPTIKIKYLMKIKLICKYNRGELSRDNLKALGVSSIRSPRRIPTLLSQYIKKIEENLVTHPDN